MATTGRKDAKLEKIREDIPTLPDINQILTNLTTTPKIHPAYLSYTKEGNLLLKEICILLSGTRRTYLYAGWEQFGIELGLEQKIINVIKNSLHMEDPAFYVFLAYMQNENATIEKILFSLYEIERHDILYEIKDSVQTVCDSILREYNTDGNKDIIRPAFIPNGPFILTKTRFVTETLNKSVPQTRQPTRESKRPYTKTVLLTYSHDADNIIKELLVNLRRPRNGLRIGVLVLHEQQYQMSLCPEEFISECFEQIDFVLPIMTMQYLNQITSNKNDTNFSPLENPDHKYVKYIYRLMNTHYLNNGCKNTKVRCIIPDAETSNVLRHRVMSHSLFQVWVRISKLDSLIDVILKSHMN